MAWLFAPASGTPITLDRLCHLAQLELLDLAGTGLRKFRKYQVARAFVGRQVLAAPLHQLVGTRLCTRLQFNERAGRLAPFLVGLGNYRGGGNGGVLV